jgi:hypothetical protein
MKDLPEDISDEGLITFIDQWITLLEREDYDAAYNYINQDSETDWPPELIREVIKSYGDADPKQKVTLEGTPSDITQRKEVDWWTTEGEERLGEIWYDLNIDGKVSDLTATFNLRSADAKVTVHLNDIHVM